MQMFVNGEPVPAGPAEVSFELRQEKGEQFALLHVVSPSEDDNLGGITLNCLYVGDAISLDALFNKPLKFGGADGDPYTELAESVVWHSGHEDLSLASLQVLIEPCTPETVMLTVQAKCYDIGFPTFTHVEVRGEAPAKQWQRRPRHGSMA